MRSNPSASNTVRTSASSVTPRSSSGRLAQIATAAFAVSEIVRDGEKDAPIICRTVAKHGRHFRVLGKRARRSPFLDFLARDDKGAIVLVEALENISSGSLHVDDDCTMHQWQW